MIYFVWSEKFLNEPSLGFLNVLDTLFKNVDIMKLEYLGYFSLNKNKKCS